MLYLYTGTNKAAKDKDAQALALQLNQKIHRINLSAILSKYIGETEKNLARLLIKAENQNWILFFDEADALFGKRSSVRDSHNRFENQETDHLLKYIKRYCGVAVISTNNKTKLSDKLKAHFKQIHVFN